MRILFLGNNWVAWKIAAWLKEQGDEIAGLVLHSPERRKYGQEILAAVGFDTGAVIDGSRLHEEQVLELIQRCNADIALSVFFGYILKPNLLRLFPQGVINLHPAYLPYNRGAYPNVWSIVDQTPAGVTMHYVDNGVDTGDIISQQRLPVEPTDTGGSLYSKLEQACVALFKDTWPRVRSGQVTRRPQSAEGTVHRVRDVEFLDKIDLEQTYTARQLIDILRARTFSPYPGAYFEVDGRRIYVRLELSEQ